MRSRRRPHPPARGQGAIPPDGSFVRNAVSGFHRSGLSPVSLNSIGVNPISESASPELTELEREVPWRRTFAIVSHADTGKTPLRDEAASKAYQKPRQDQGLLPTSIVDVNPVVPEYLNV